MTNINLGRKANMLAPQKVRLRGIARLNNGSLRDGHHQTSRVEEKKNLLPESYDPEEKIKEI